MNQVTGPATQDHTMDRNPNFLTIILYFFLTGPKKLYKVQDSQNLDLPQCKGSQILFLANH
jgi:hypothetical protein